MSRARRFIDDDGFLECGLCKELVHISGFYTLPIYEDTRVEDIWWGDPYNGKHYGRPKSYCRPCNQASQKGTKHVQELKALRDARDAARIHDPIKAETKAYIERARRMWAAEEAAMELSRNGADRSVD